MFAAVGGVSDELLASWIDYEVQQFHRHLADEDRAFVCNFGDVTNAVSTLNG